jgi:SagB-type dehydrogenase family enzyme
MHVRMMLSFSLIIAASLQSFAQTSSSTKTLPKPETTGGKPLMQVLSERRSSRSFSAKPLADQTLSNLLWAAFGINRPDGHRTAPSAMNWQEIDIYVATADGMFLYDAKAHALHQLMQGDLRAKTGGQDFVAKAPVNLIYVADLKKVTSQNPDDIVLYTSADCGFIAQNVYLYCASEGLAAVVRGWVDRKELSRTLNLRPDQRIILSQTVGYPD